MQVSIYREHTSEKGILLKEKENQNNGLYSNPTVWSLTNPVVSQIERAPKSMAFCKIKPSSDLLF